MTLFIQLIHLENSKYQLQELENLPKKVSLAINNIHSKKAPGYNLITGKILKELPLEGITYLTYLFNSILNKGFFPSQWKVAQIRMILKQGKTAIETKSYRPISLLPITTKLLEKLFLSRLMPVIEEKELISIH